jgi:ribosomal protein S18 acetylase RimI-like enzyme
MKVLLCNVLPQDVGLMHEFILALAKSDGVAEILTTIESLNTGLFGDAPSAFPRFIKQDGTVAGFVIYSWKWGVFTGVRDMYLQALYIDPAFRRHGLARAAMSELAWIAVASGCSRMEWLTVRGKEASGGFYDSIGSKEATHMMVRRIHGDNLVALAKTASR